MGAYRYEVLTETSEPRKGRITAPDISTAETMLHEQGLDLVRLTPVTIFERIYFFLQNEVTPRRPIRAGILAGYVRNLASLLGAGISISDALNVAGRSLKGRFGDRRRLKLLADGTARRVANGAGLAAALAEFRSETGARLVAAVRAGEEGGRVAEVLSRLAEELTKRDGAHKAMTQALIYPILLAMSATVALGVLLGVVVPTISGLIDPSRIDRLPFMTRVLFTVSTVAREWGVFVSLSLVLVLIFVLTSLLTEAGRAEWSRLLFRLETVRLHLVGRFLGDVELLLAAAVPLDRALRLAVEGIRSVELRSRCMRVVDAVVAGGALSEALERGGVLDSEGATLIRVGERSGRLAERVRDASDLLSRNATDRFKAVGALAGPLLTIAFGLVCGFVATALLTTILSLNDLATS